jgi:hypothetical protein
MKNLLFLFGLVLFLASCGSNLEDDIVGDYAMSSIQYADCDDPSDNESLAWDADGCQVESGDTYCLSINFTDAGTVTLVNTETEDGVTSTDSSSGTYSLDGDNITLNFSGFSLSGTAELDGDLLTIVGTDSEFPSCTFTLVARMK